MCRLIPVLYPYTKHNFIGINQKEECSTCISNHNVLHFKRWQMPGMWIMWQILRENLQPTCACARSAREAWTRRWNTQQGQSYVSFNSYIHVKLLNSSVFSFSAPISSCSLSVCMYILISCFLFLSLILLTSWYTILMILITYCLVPMNYLNHYAIQITLTIWVTVSFSDRKVLTFIATESAKTKTTWLGCGIAHIQLWKVQKEVSNTQVH